LCKKLVFEWVKPIFYSHPLRSNNSTTNNDIITEDADLGCDPMSLGEWFN